MLVCKVCGYVFDGDKAPDACPKCSAGPDKFEKLGEKEAGLIERSRYTNSLHTQLMSMLEEVVALTEEGIKDDLDPGCRRLFAKTQAHAIESIQMVKAELLGHMKKGKWG